MICQRKVDRARFRGWCADASGVMNEAFKVIKFPVGVGEEESDFLLRRLLAKGFKWAGSSPWPYGHQYVQH